MAKFFFLILNLIQNFNFKILIKKTIFVFTFLKILKNRYCGNLDFKNSPNFRILKQVQNESKLIKEKAKENQINLTYRKIAEKTKTSYGTVAETFKALKEANLIKKHGGLYVLNTTIISAYGSSEKNAYLTIEYNFTNRSLVKENPFEKVKSNIKLQRELESKNKELAKKEKELAKQQEEFKQQEEELKILRELLKKQS